MHKFVFTSVFLILVNNAIAQYTVGLPIQAPTQMSKHQLINYLLSNFNQAPLGERIGVLTTAVQQMPPRKNRRVHLADVLKKSALQSLLVAASVCNEGTASGPGIPERVGPLKGFAAPIQRNSGIVPAEALIANREFSGLLPRELLSSLLAGDSSNRSLRLQVV